MNLATITMLGQTALELGLIGSLTTLSTFLSYAMLNVCDLAADGVFTLGATVGASVVLSGHPWLSILAAMFAGMTAGLVNALLQTRMGIDSLLSGIIVNTALYSINIAVMGGSSLLNMNKSVTVFTMMKDLIADTPLAGWQTILIALIAAALIIIFLSIFLKTRLGLAIRATGNNPDMVKASSVDPRMTITVGLVIANAFTGLSGALMAQSQKSVNINIGTGMMTIALASLLIGQTFFGKGRILVQAIGAVIGSIIFRVVYTIALRLNLPAYMLKFISAVIVVIAISGPYFKKNWPNIKRRWSVNSHAGKEA